MANLKHFGKYGSKNCVIIYREVPGEPDFCLIVETNLLEGTKQDAFINVINSPEGQASNEINEVLARNQFPDGTVMLHDLHYTKRLQKADVDMVEVIPNNSQSFPLRTLNDELKKLQASSNTEKLSDADLAKGLVVQADLMIEDSDRIKKDAYTKLEEAYLLDPSLKPVLEAIQAE